MVERSSTPVRAIRVFVASPGGVDAERRAAKAMAEELNGQLRSRQWQLDVFGWEERGPAAGRAQDDINPALDACDIFVGILHKRWGTPTGDHSSGFAEEWDRARRRWEDTGAPELWLYFKHPGGGESGEQFERVRAFRAGLEAEEAVFHKPFATEDEFETLIRGRLLAEVLDRGQLTRSDLAGMPPDWSVAYEHDPVWLIADGPERQRLAKDLMDSRPLEAAEILIELADEVEEHGYEEAAEPLRVQGCRALIAAGEPERAVRLLRALLAELIWWMHLNQAEHLVRQLEAELPPEFAAEARGWGACSRATEDPERAGSDLKLALEAQHVVALDDRTRASWQVVRWRCLLHTGRPDAVVEESDAVAGAPGDEPLAIELVLLRAEALRAAGHAEADAAWQQVRLRATKFAKAASETAAWLAARVALDCVASEDLEAAERAYTQAATRWSKSDGGHEQAAHAYFSARAAARLNGEWIGPGDDWRSAAARQRSGLRSFAWRAEELATEALHHRLAGENAKARVSLTAALWASQRSGLLIGVLQAESLIAEVLAAEGDWAGAVARYCHVRDAKRAREAAEKGDAEAQRATASHLAGQWPSWTDEARFDALSRCGRATPPAAAASLVPILIESLEPSGRMFDNTHTAAADALAEIALAVEDQPTLDIAVPQLRALAGDRHYHLGKSGRRGLRQLFDIGRADEVDLLISKFAEDDRFDEPDPPWVADQLTTDARKAVVREAAKRGHFRALLALLIVEDDREDGQIRELCARATQRMLADDLGMTADGSGIHGLMALDAQGAMAAASGDAALQQAAAATLLLYASETRWPMNNRVSAVAGLWPLLERNSDIGWADELERFVCPVTDLDAETPAHLRDMWVSPGDLQAMALRVAAAAAVETSSPAWLDGAVEDALVDDRPTLRAAAWNAVGSRGEWFDPRDARRGLSDLAPQVQMAAMHAWTRHASSAPAQPVLNRLAASAAIGVRLQLITLLAAHPDAPTAAKLRADSDAYVRGVARQQLG